MSNWLLSEIFTIYFAIIMCIPCLVKNAHVSSWHGIPLKPHTRGIWSDIDTRPSFLLTNLKECVICQTNLFFTWLKLWKCSLVWYVVCMYDSVNISQRLDIIMVINDILVMQYIYTYNATNGIGLFDLFSMVCVSNSCTKWMYFGFQLNQTYDY